MSQADIYKQYLSDYEDAAKRYNQNAYAYQNSLRLDGGPAQVKDSNSGKTYNLFWTPDGTRQIVQRGTQEEYQAASQGSKELGAYIPDVQTNPANSTEVQSTTGSWTKPQGQNPSAYHAWGSIGGGEGYYSDLGNGVAAMRTGGKPTGNYVTERISGDQARAEELAKSGRYKDVKFVNQGEDGFIDVTYEEMKFPDKPGEFAKRPPSLTISQLKEIENPTPTAADEVRGEDLGLINNVRLKERQATNGLIR